MNGKVDINMVDNVKSFDTSNVVLVDNLKAFPIFSNM